MCLEIKIFDGMDDDGNPRAAENTENDEYDADGKQSTVEQPNKIKQSDHKSPNKTKQSAHQSNLKRDSSSCAEQETNKEGDN
jgi:hypothetical protein